MKKIITAFLFSLIFSVPLFSQTIIQTSDEIVLPQYMIFGGTTPSRLQYVCRLRLTGLNANSTYRYHSGAHTSSTLTTTTSGGVLFVINNISGASGYITGHSSNKSLAGSLMSGNEFNTTASSRYGEFTTDGDGTYTGWFGTAATGNAVFTAGNSVYFYVQLNDGAGGTSITQVYRTFSTITMLNYGTTAGASNQATAMIGKSFASNEDMILLFDNTSGTGRPLFATWTENDGITTNYTTWYNPASGNGAEGFPGRWGAILPNNLPGGLQRIERRAIDYSLVDYSLSLTGMWGALNTINPSSGNSPVSIDSTNSPLPVVIGSFSSNVLTNSVSLHWTTLEEINNKGFEIERTTNAAANLWKQIGFIQGHGTVTQSQDYYFSDINLITGKYFYRLKQIDYNGNFEYYPLNKTNEIGTPNNFEIKQNFPNPFNPATQISYSLPFDSKVQLAVYDAAGKLVSELFNSNIEKGYHTVEFNGANIASGIYFYRLKAQDLNSGNEFSKIMKMVLIK